MDRILLVATCATTHIIRTDRSTNPCQPHPEQPSAAEAILEASSLTVVPYAANGADQKGLIPGWFATHDVSYYPPETPKTLGEEYEGV